MTENKQDTPDASQIQKQMREKIETSLRDLRKQCKQLSKNELITALLQQIEKYSELQGAAQLLFEENKKLKSAQEAKDKNENVNS